VRRYQIAVCGSLRRRSEVRSAPQLGDDIEIAFRQFDLRGNYGRGVGVAMAAMS